MLSRALVRRAPSRPLCLRSASLSSAATRRRPELPEPQTIDVVNGRYALKYIDLRPATAAKKPTIVLIHGAPGSHQDYKYLIPHLQDHARIVAVNLPGNGDSQVLDRDNYYEHIRAENLALAARDALLKLCGTDDDVFVVGHSFGGHATINVTALNELEDAAERKLNIRGLALLASAGLRIHHVLEKSNLKLFHRLLASDYRIVEATGRAATRYVYTRVWKFPTRVPTEQYVAGLVRCASTDFAVVNDHAARIAHLPSFFAWAKDDGYIQDEIFHELSTLCAPGPRFVFEKGGHNIQKTKAEFLATELLAWTQSVVCGDAPAATREIKELP